MLIEGVLNLAQCIHREQEMDLQSDARPSWLSNENEVQEPRRFDSAELWVDDARDLDTSVCEQFLASLVV